MKRPYANCRECGDARPAHVLQKGVCPWCLLTVVLTKDNPLLPR